MTYGLKVSSCDPLTQRWAICISHYVLETRVCYVLKMTETLIFFFIQMLIISI